MKTWSECSDAEIYRDIADTLNDVAADRDAGAYRRFIRNSELLEREWLGMPFGILADAMIDGAGALQRRAAKSLKRAIINGQLLRCYP